MFMETSKKVWDSNIWQLNVSSENQNCINNGVEEHLLSFLGRQ
jgi:hypothetical protein